MSGTDDAKRETFARKLTDILNLGALNLAMGIGYRARLFDVMDTLDQSASAEDIAARASLDTRYVREWLGIMVCGGVVALSRGEGGEDRFLLPKEHADLITRRAGNANLGVYTQEIPLLTDCVMEEVVDGFQTGQGVGYDRYPRFQAFMSELADAKHREVLVNRFCRPWTGAVVGRMRPGFGFATWGAPKAWPCCSWPNTFPPAGSPASTFPGKPWRKRARRGRQSAPIYLRQPGCRRLNETSDRVGTFDYVTAFDAIHDQTRPLEALEGVYHMLKPGGRFSMVDIAARTDLVDNLDHPMGPFLYTVSLMHCMPVGLVDGGIGLGMMWGREQAVAMLEAAGFDEVGVRTRRTPSTSTSSAARRRRRKMANISVVLHSSSVRRTIVRLPPRNLHALILAILRRRRLDGGSFKIRRLNRHPHIGAVRPAASAACGCPSLRQLIVLILNGSIRDLSGLASLPTPTICR